MPVLSMFYGVVIRMQSEKGGKHHEPHIHCIYGNDELVMSLSGDVLEGSLPKNKQKLVEAWVLLHEDELNANWQMLSEGEGFFRIDPLR